MTNLPWYIPVILAFAGGFFLGWKGCEREQPPAKTITVIERDTITEYVKADPITIEKPVPYKVVEYVEVEPDPPDFTLDKLREYVDTLRADGLTIGYNIRTRGTLEWAEFSPEFEREKIYETTTITNTIDNTKKLRGLYFGVSVGGNKSEFGTLAPGLDYVTPRVIVGANYNLMDATVNVRVGRKLF